MWQHDRRRKEGTMDGQMKGEWERRMEKRTGGTECQGKGQFLIKHIGEGHVIFCVTKFLIVIFASENGMGKSK